MSQREELRSVVHFDETHAINEHEILEKLRAVGVAAGLFRVGRDLSILEWLARVVLAMQRATLWLP